MLKHTKPIWHHIKCYFILFFDQQWSFFVKVYLQGLGKLFPAVLVQEARLSLSGHQEACSPKATNHLGTSLIGMRFCQINASLPCSRQPVTRPQYVHRISGAVRLG